MNLHIMRLKADKNFLKYFLITFCVALQLIVQTG